MFQRFKVSKLPDASGELELFINKTADIRVIATYVVLPGVTTTSQNTMRNVTLRRPDGTILGTQLAPYCTSQAIGLVFPDPFILPIYDPVFVVDTASVIVAGAVKTITVDMIYEEVRFER